MDKWQRASACGRHIRDLLVQFGEAIGTSYDEGNPDSLITVLVVFPLVELGRVRGFKSVGVVPLYIWMFLSTRIQRDTGLREMLHQLCRHMDGYIQENCILRALKENPPGHDHFENKEAAFKRGLNLIVEGEFRVRALNTFPETKPCTTSTLLHWTDIFH